MIFFFSRKNLTMKQMAFQSPSTVVFCMFLYFALLLLWRLEYWQDGTVILLAVGKHPLNGILT